MNSCDDARLQGFFFFPCWCQQVLFHPFWLEYRRRFFVASGASYPYLILRCQIHRSSCKWVAGKCLHELNFLKCRDNTKCHITDNIYLFFVAGGLDNPLNSPTISVLSLNTSVQVNFRHIGTSYRKVTTPMFHRNQGASSSQQQQKFRVRESCRFIRSVLNFLLSYKSSCNLKLTVTGNTFRIKRYSLKQNL